MTEETIFADALSKPAGERADYIAAACGHNAALRRRVQALVAAHDPVDRFLEPPTSPHSPAGSSFHLLGSYIGPYHLLKQIGEGGMGVVYLAEQDKPVRRLVALKVIKPGMDSAQVVARFEAERQALAIMNHPNIARVFDAGATESGRPYFVMELVTGLSITKYCDQERLTPRERLELFVPVCQAVQHAHQKGIIHRDLKPSNVLIALDDGRPVPKVIDFGVAKAMYHRSTERTMFTGLGQVIGTLEYMSPEQAESSAIDVDTRSDIYSLGVLLYELLTGMTPLDKKKLHSAALGEMLRIIREEEPAKPSTRLSQSGDALPSISAQRKTEPGALPRIMRGELDWIVMKCLEKDRGHRYETANGLARDIQRHLNDEPVEACPPSAGYRLRKFLRKHRGPVTAVAVAAGLLVAGIVGTSWGLVEALRQKREASQQANNARAVSDFLQHDLLGQADVSMQPEAAGGRDPDVKVRTLLDRTARTLDGRFLDQPLTEAAIRMTLAVTYRNLGFSNEAQPHAERAENLRVAVLGPANHDVLHARLLRALLLYDQGKFTDSELLCLNILDATKHYSWQNDDRNQAREYLALIARARGQYLKARTLYEELLHDAIARHDENCAKTQALKHGLAVVHHHLDAYEQAAKLFQEAATWHSDNLGQNHRDTQNSLQGLASSYTAMGKFDLAEPIYRDLIKTASQLRPDHPNLLNYKDSLAMLRFRQGDYHQAEALYREVLEARVAKRGADHPETLGTRNSLAAALVKLGNLDQAVSLHRESAEGARKIHGLAHPDTQLFICNLIITYEEMNRHDLAEPWCRELTDFWTSQAKANNMVYKPRLTPIGEKLLGLKEFAKAATIFQVEMAMCDKLDAEGWMPGHAKLLLGTAFLGQSKFADAEPLLNDGFDGLTRRVGKIPRASRQAVLVDSVERIIRLYETAGKTGEAASWRLRLETGTSAGLLE